MARGKDTACAAEIQEGFQEEVAVEVSWSQARAGEVPEVCFRLCVCLRC